MVAGHRGRLHGATLPTADSLLCAIRFCLAAIGVREETGAGTAAPNSGSRKF
jgi:hypothetical protein